MSGLVKSVGKKFRKAGLLGKIAMVAAVWWAAGTASAYFSNPAVGLGQAAAASTESMYLTATTGSFVAPSEIAAATIEAESAIAAVTAASTEATVAGSAAMAPEAAVGATQSAVSPAVAGAGSVAPVAPAATAPAAGMTTGQMATMMIGGQALTGAYGAYEQEKAREQEESARRSRGLMGFDYEGNYGGRQGVVSSQVPAAPTTEKVTGGPAVDPQTVNAPAAPQVRPINRNNLPELSRQGLIAQQQVT